MNKEIDPRVNISLSLPLSVIRELDAKRGQVARSKFVLAILQEAMQKGLRKQ